MLSLLLATLFIFYDKSKDVGDVKAKKRFAANVVDIIFTITFVVVAFAANVITCFDRKLVIMKSM